MRSMRFAGLGPRDGCMFFLILHKTMSPQFLSFSADSLGGDLYWSAGLSVISDIPKKGHWPLKTHMFLNAGRLDGIDKCQSLSSAVSQLPLIPQLHSP